MSDAVLPAAMDKRGHDRILGEPEAGMDAMELLTRCFDSNAAASAASSSAPWSGTAAPGDRGGGYGVKTLRGS
jgi:hypothetical protein